MNEPAQLREALRGCLFRCALIAVAILLLVVLAPKREPQPRPGQAPAPKQSSGYANRTR